MVPNGAAYNNFPPFGTNGTKTPPGGTTESAKYALGMVPADTFPAEWANYLFYGATQGITRLNQDTGSIKKELNSVLSNFNITPDATDNDQLLEALTKLKAEAALAAHPVGSLYWTSVNENPATTFGGGTWEQIKDKFILAAGDTYSQGATGGSATVTLTTAQMPNHTHTMESAGDHTHTTNSQSTATTGATNLTHSHTGGTKVIHDMVDGAYGSTAVSTGTVNYPAARGMTNVKWKQNYTDTALGDHTHPFNHTHGTDSKGAHTHTINAAGGLNGTTQAHDNMPPYIVQYCWKRTA